MIFRIYELPVWAYGLMILAPLLLAMELGAWNGRRSRERSGTAEDWSNDKRRTLEIGALLALMGLVLAFTYSFSLSRIDLRKDALVQEVNAIGTAFLRADLLPEPGRTELRAHLLDYARTRLMTEDAKRSLALAQRQIEESLAAQAELWPATKRALQADVPAPVKILNIQAINDVIDAHTVRIAVGFDRLPMSVFILMVGVAALSVGFAAQIAAQEGMFIRARISAFALVLSGLIFIIVDFDNSSRGLVQMSQDSVVALIRDMEREIK